MFLGDFAIGGCKREASSIERRITYK